MWKGAGQRRCTQLARLEVISATNGLSFVVTGPQYPFGRQNRGMAAFSNITGTWTPNGGGDNNGMDHTGNPDRLPRGQTDLCKREHAAQRSALTAALKHPRTREACTAHTFVSDSKIGRGVLTAVGWLMSKPYQERIFDTLDPALQWLGGFRPSLDWTTVARDIRSAVPDVSL